MNQTCLIGRITRDPELKKTQSDKSVTSFTLAVNRTFKNANGEREADFINIVAWNKRADNIVQWCSKGDLISIVGSINTRNYENQQGQLVYVTEVIANNFQKLEKRQAQQAAADTYDGGTPMDLSDDDLPF